MNNIKEFDGTSNLRSLLSFWLATAPTLAVILLLTVVVILWKRKWAIDLRSEWGDSIKEKWGRFRKKPTDDVEKSPHASNSQLIPNGSSNSPGPSQTHGGSLAPTTV